MEISWIIVIIFGVAFVYNNYRFDEQTKRLKRVINRLEMAKDVLKKNNLPVEHLTDD